MPPDRIIHAVRRGGGGQDSDSRGLSQQIVNKTSRALKDKHMVLDLAMMVAGTKYPRQFEERIKAVINGRRAQKWCVVDELIHW
jgi:ATP-dependent Clp protease ATP-binding subunit ClpC